MDKVFVRRSWYVQMPTKGSSLAEWKKWQREDDKAAMEARRRFDKSFKITQPIEVTPESPVTMVDGIYKQVPFIRFKCRRWR